jgi:prenyl protein peptidase
MYDDYPPPHIVEEEGYDDDDDDEDDEDDAEDEDDDDTEEDNDEDEPEDTEGDTVDDSQTTLYDDTRERSLSVMSLHNTSLTLSTAFGYCFFTSIAFVGSLYMFVPRSIQALDRNHPRQIKWRSLATSLVCVGALVCQAYLLPTASAKVESIRNVWDDASYFFTVEHTLFSSVKVLTHVTALYSGSILDSCLRVFTYMRKRQQNPSGRGGIQHQVSEFIHLFHSSYMTPLLASLSFANNEQGWITWRNLIIAPFLEEIAFRTCMVPILLAAGLDTFTICLVSPLFFGVAHAHHALQRLQEGINPITVTVTTVFQFAYTSLFGAYAAYVYIHTQSTMAITLAHGFCNLMGLPNFTFSARHHDLYEYRWVLFSAHVLGLSCFVTVLVQGFLL